MDHSLHIINMNRAALNYMCKYTQRQMYLMYDNTTARLFLGFNNIQ